MPSLTAAVYLRERAVAGGAAGAGECAADGTCSRIAWSAPHDRSKPALSSRYEQQHCTTA